jgi:hypothetical protein
MCPSASQITSTFLGILIGDCHDSYGHKHRCVIGAIYNYTMQLKLANADASSELKCKHLWITLLICLFHLKIGP